MMRSREGIDHLFRAATLEADTATPDRAFDTLAEIVEQWLYEERGAEMLPVLDRLEALAAHPFQRVGAPLLRSDYSMFRKERRDEVIAAAKRVMELATHAGLDWFRVGGTPNVAMRCVR
jgi:hypothetical protein